MTAVQFDKIALIGIGLIGSSIAHDIKRLGLANDVVIATRSAQTLRRAEELKLGDRYTISAAEAAKDADLVIVSVPVGASESIARQIAPYLKPGAIVTDVGSTKRVVAEAGSDARFIGGHPLAGAETAGVEHAREDLFEAATWYLTPAQGSTAGVLYERLHRLLTSMGARPAAIDADTHDRLLACVSQLPHVLANLLAAQAAGALSGQEPRRLPAVGPSFRDATRVAGANSGIWTDIYMSNRDALAAAIDEFAQRLVQMRSLLAAADAVGVRAWNESARVDREALLGPGVTGGPVHELRVSVPNRPGVIAEIALALGGAGVNIADMALSPSEDNSQGVVALWVSGEEQGARAQELIAGLGFPVARA